MNTYPSPSVVSVAHRQNTAQRLYTQLREAKVYDDCMEYVAGRTEYMPIQGDALMVYNFLEYIRLSHVSISLADTLSYLDTCIRISGISEDHMEWLLMHLQERAYTADPRKIDTMLQNFYYGGQKTTIEHIVNTIRTDPSKKEDTISELRDDVRHQHVLRAGFHIYLSDIYSWCIEPYIQGISRKEYTNICTNLNNLRDIFDPKGYIPVSFGVAGTVADTVEIHSIRVGRVFH